MNIPHVENILYKADISLIAAVGDGLLKDTVWQHAYSLQYPNKE